MIAPKANETQAQEWCTTRETEGHVETCTHHGFGFVIVTATWSQLLTLSSNDEALSGALIEQAYYLPRIDRLVNHPSKTSGRRATATNKARRVLPEDFEFMTTDTTSLGGDISASGGPARRRAQSDPYTILQGRSCRSTDDVAGAGFSMNSLDVSDGDSDDEATPDNCFTTAYTGDGVTAYIVDEQVRVGHDEFGDRAEEWMEGYVTGLEGQSHGTHVAGTIGGTNVGYAPDVAIYGLTVTDDDGQMDVSLINAAQIKVAREGPRPGVINLSLGSVFYSYSTLTAVLDHILTDLGIVVVRAAGNEASYAHLIEPGHSDKALQVGASDVVGGDPTMSSFSNYGLSVDLFAPGETIWSASEEDDDSYIAQDGTSMAAPAVAGAVALYLEHSPDAAPEAVHRIVYLAAQPLVTDHKEYGENQQARSDWTDRFLQTDGLEKASLIYSTVTAVEVKESGREYTFTVYLRSSPSASLVFNLAVSDPDSLVLVSDDTVTVASGTGTGEDNGFEVTVRSHAAGMWKPVTWLDITVESTDALWDGAVHAVAFKARKGVNVKGMHPDYGFVLRDLGDKKKPFEIWYDLWEMNTAFVHSDISVAYAHADIVGNGYVYYDGLYTDKDDGDRELPHEPFTCQGGSMSEESMPEAYWFFLKPTSGTMALFFLILHALGTHVLLLSFHSTAEPTRNTNNIAAYLHTHIYI